MWTGSPEVAMPQNISAPRNVPLQSNMTLVRTAKRLTERLLVPSSKEPVPINQLSTQEAVQEGMILKLPGLVDDGDFAGIAPLGLWITDAVIEPETPEGLLPIKLSGKLMTPFGKQSFAVTQYKPVPFSISYTMKFSQSKKVNPIVVRVTGFTHAQMGKQRP